MAPGGSSDHTTYQLAAVDGRACRLDAIHGDEPPSTTDVVTVVRSWDGVEITVAVDFDENLAVVDDSDRSSDWTKITCDSPEAAQFLASHVWVAP